MQRKIGTEISLGKTLSPLTVLTLPLPYTGQRQTF